MKLLSSIWDLNELAMAQQFFFFVLSKDAKNAFEGGQVDLNRPLSFRTLSCPRYFQFYRKYATHEFDYY